MYIMGSTQVTIAFSNPVVGYSKLGVGTGHHGKDVWEDMSDHNYKSFNVILPIADKNLIFCYQCIGSTTNTCAVEIAPQ